MFGRAARPWSRILVSLMLVLFVTDEKSVQAAAGGIPAACRAARDSWLGARSMSPAVDQKLESLSWGTGVGVRVCGGISVERENGVVLMRLRGGFTAKKSRKSKSKRKTLKLKYKIKKRVVQHYRKKRRVKAIEERDKKSQREKGKMPDKPKIRYKDDMSWMISANSVNKMAGNKAGAKQGPDSLEKLSGGSWDLGGNRQKKHVSPAPGGVRSKKP